MNNLETDYLSNNHICIKELFLPCNSYSEYNRFCLCSVFGSIEVIEGDKNNSDFDLNDCTLVINTHGLLSNSTVATGKNTSLISCCLCLASYQREKTDDTKH